LPFWHCGHHARNHQGSLGARDADCASDIRAGRAESDARISGSAAQQWTEVGRSRDELVDDEVYLRVYESMSDARRHLDRYLTFYIGWRPHISLADQTPDAVGFKDLKIAA
jgi:hypothetical protein